MTAGGGTVETPDGDRRGAAPRRPPAAWWLLLVVVAVVSGAVGALIQSARSGPGEQAAPVAGAATDPAPVPSAPPHASAPGVRPSASPPARAVAPSEQAGSQTGTAFPDGGTTGVVDDARLAPSGSLVIERDGEVVEDVDVAGTIKVRANDVQIRNVRITTGSALYGIEIASGSTGTVIEDIAIIGSGECSAGIVHGDYVARRIDVKGCVDGLRVGGASTLVADSYIHDQVRIPDSHNDAIQSVGGRNIVLTGNRIEGPYQDSTSAVLLQANMGALSDVVIDGNHLSGGSYSLYVQFKDGRQPPERVRVMNNVWAEDSFVHGPASVGDAVDIEWTGNTYSDGEPIG